MILSGAKGFQGDACKVGWRIFLLSATPEHPKKLPGGMGKAETPQKGQWGWGGGMTSVLGKLSGKSNEETLL